METISAIAVAGALTIVVLHFLEGGDQQVRTLLDFWFTGRGPGRNGGPSPASNTSPANGERPTMV